jgi:hypothetical protein
VRTFAQHILSFIVVAGILTAMAIVGGIEGGF